MRARPRAGRFRPAGGRPRAPRCRTLRARARTSRSIQQRTWKPRRTPLLVADMTSFMEGLRVEASIASTVPVVSIDPSRFKVEDRHARRRSANIATPVTDRPAQVQTSYLVTPKQEWPDSQGLAGGPPVCEGDTRPNSSHMSEGPRNSLGAFEAVRDRNRRYVRAAAPDSGMTMARWATARAAHCRG
jgi:hypothetical protein